MSIIQEALKKVQSNSRKDRIPGENNFEKSTIHPRYEALKKRTNKNTEGLSFFRKKMTFRSIAPFLALIFFASLLAAAYISISGIHRSGNAKNNIAKDESPSPASYQEVTYRPIQTEKDSIGAAGAPYDRSAESLTIVTGMKYPEFILNGIMYIEGGPRAIINNSIVEEGDAVSGANIKRIDRKSVVLEYNGVEIVLNLKR